MGSPIKAKSADQCKSIGILCEYCLVGTFCGGGLDHNGARVPEDWLIGWFGSLYKEYLGYIELVIGAPLWGLGDYHNALSPPPPHLRGMGGDP
ncbi:hypothetical protein G9A89_000477 [Geosiphon pyriformis]|nr:hypothetical protein G9A89_000477 [Geosiphon pyriformis]